MTQGTPKIAVDVTIAVTANNFRMAEETHAALDVIDSNSDVHGHGEKPESERDASATSDATAVLKSDMAHHSSSRECH